jgi:hypothetical protein
MVRPPIRLGRRFKHVASAELIEERRARISSAAPPESRVILFGSRDPGQLVAMLDLPEGELPVEVRAADQLSPRAVTLRYDHSTAPLDRGMAVEAAGRSPRWARQRVASAGDENARLKSTS